MRSSFNRLAYVEPAPSPWLIHAMGWINRFVILPHVLRVRSVELPAADAARLASAVRPGTAAFLSPNHPEFTTDWMLDKEISRRVSPLMAHWGAYDIVNASPLAQRFWLANHLIANAPGGEGKSYAIDQAIAGHGVLLHSEGTATWCGDRIAPLVPGIADLAWGAWSRLRGRGDGSPRTSSPSQAIPVYVVPIVWKLHFERNVESALHGEITRIAKVLRLAIPRHEALAVRFARLHCGILARQCARFAYETTEVRAERFFDVQERLARHLIARLARRHGAPDGHLGRWLHGIRRSIRTTEPSKGVREDLRIAREIERLHRFVRIAHSGPRLAQEEIAESLKQLHASFVTRTRLDVLRNLLPVAVAPRRARIRVPEPLEAGTYFADEGAEASRARLLADLETRMQGALDALNAEIAGVVDPYRHRNPFVADRIRRITPAARAPAESPPPPPGPDQRFSMNVPSSSS